MRRRSASTATMLGDWDLQSTLLRRTLQEGALRLPVAPDGGEPILADSSEQLEGFQRGLVAASRGTRRDWASRYVLPPVEEFATAQLMETGVRPGWLIWAALALTLAGAAAFSSGVARRRAGDAGAFDAARHDRRASGDSAPETASGTDAQP